MIAFGGLGIASFLAALVATIPAWTVIPRSPTIHGSEGTVWRGSVALAGGNRLGWGWAPLRSLISFGFAADWSASGEGTDIAGRALVRGDRFVLDEVAGSANGGLVGAVLDDLPFACDTVMQVDLKRLAIGAGTQEMKGEMRSAAGTCADRGGGAATSVEPLILTAEHIAGDSTLRVAPLGQRRISLMTGTLSGDGELTLSVTREGVQRMPFIGLPGASTIAMKL